MAEVDSSDDDYSSDTSEYVMSPGAKATQNYKPGDVISFEKHFVHLVHRQFKGKFCDNCMKPL
jgi:putative aminopeptidase FrvX